METRKKQLLNEFTQIIRSQQNCLSDPMNGCPEDFAEDFEKQNRRRVAALFIAGATDEEIMRAEEEGHRLANEDYEETFGGY